MYSKDSSSDIVPPWDILLMDASFVVMGTYVATREGTVSAFGASVGILFAVVLLIAFQGGTTVGPIGPLSERTTTGLFVVLGGGAAGLFVSLWTAPFGSALIVTGIGHFLGRILLVRARN